MIQLRSIRILCLHTLGTKIHVVQVSASCSLTVWENETDNAICRLLLFINTAQFLLCTAQITLHTISLFLLFTVVTDVSAWIQRVNVYIVGSTIIYNTNVGLSILVLLSVRVSDQTCL